MIDADVLVVGGGLGGLSAAAHLARAGKRVLVVDRNEEVGGFATTFARGPFRFEASLHLLDAALPGQPNHEVLVSSGIADRLDLRSPPSLYRLRWAARGWDVVVGNGEEAAIEAMESLTPGAGAGMRSLLAEARTLYDACFPYLASDRPPSDAALTAILRSLSRTALDVLKAHVPDPDVRDTLLVPSIYHALTPPEMSGLQYLLLLSAYHRYGGCYPVGGSRALSEALRDVIVEGGGALLRGEVDGLRVEGGRVVGGHLADGTDVRARAVVSAIAPLVTFGRLLPRGTVPDRYQRRLDAMIPSGSLVRLSLGLDLDPCDHGLDEYECHLPHARTDDPRSTVSASFPARLDPTAAPPGHGVVQLTGAAPARWAPDAPKPERDAVADIFLGIIERELLPGVSRHVVARDFAHPGTYARYGGVPGGAVFGYAATPAQSGPRRLPAATPIRSLFLAGGWVFPGSGQTPALWSGRIAANRVLEELP